MRVTLHQSHKLELGPTSLDYIARSILQPLNVIIITKAVHAIQQVVLCSEPIIIRCLASFHRPAICLLLLPYCWTPEEISNGSFY